MTDDTTTPTPAPSEPVAGPVQRPVRPDVERVMGAVWDLVRGGPNFDGRQHNVEAAIAAAIDRAVSEERKRWRAWLERCAAAVSGVSPAARNALLAAAQEYEA